MACATVLLAVQRIPLALGRDFDPDELQHVHGGYSIVRGETPFEDYFEHHTPWTPMALSALVRALGADWNTLMAARVLFASLGILGIAAVWFLAKRLVSAAGACAAALVFASLVYGVDKSIEIRPDVPAALCFTVALALGLDALRTDRRGAAALSGLMLGAAIALTPKVAFGALGVGCGALVHIALRPERRVRGLGVLSILVAASTVPLLVTFALVAMEGYASAFVDAVVLGPLEWEREISPRVHLIAALKRNPLSIGAGLAGMLALVARSVISRGRDPAHIVLPAVAVSISIGWFIVPVPWPQFMLPLWPVIAVGAAVILDEARSSSTARVTLALGVLALAGWYAHSLSQSGGATTYQNWWMRDALRPAAWLAGACALGIAGRATLEGFSGGGRVAGVALAAIACAATGHAALRVQPHSFEYGPLWILMFGAAVLATDGRRWSALGLALLVAGPFTILARQLDERPIAPFRAEFDLIMAETEPDETVLTGWRGCAVFRPHAYRYFFLHKGVLQMLTEEERGPDVVQALESNPPAAAVRDEATRALGAGVQRLLDEQFEPSGVGDIWLRRVD